MYADKIHQRVIFYYISFWLYNKTVHVYMFTRLLSHPSTLNSYDLCCVTLMINITTNHGGEKLFYPFTERYIKNQRDEQHHKLQTKINSNLKS